jgi:hypothetical protein
MVCANPVTNTLSSSSLVQVPTILNGVFFGGLLLMFAYMYNYDDRVIKGTPMPSVRQSNSAK